MSYVPITNFSPDHWSTLLFVAYLIPNHQGFKVGYEPRMRQNRRNYRVMREQCARPRGKVTAEGVVMDLKYSTVMKDGTVETGHDDWACVQDMVVAGLLAVRDDGCDVCDVELVEPGAVLFLTPMGEQMVTDLNRHKANGGSLSTFSPPFDLVLMKDGQEWDRARIGRGYTPEAAHRQMDEWKMKIIREEPEAIMNVIYAPAD